MKIYFKLLKLEFHGMKNLIEKYKNRDNINLLMNPTLIPPYHTLVFQNIIEFMKNKQKIFFFSKNYGKP